MTFRQMGVGAVIGFSISALAFAGVLPQPLAPAGLIIVIGGFLMGAVDGTIPRMH